MRVSTRDLPEPYKPCVSRKQARQAAPFKELPPVLHPRMNFPIPPCMHFGLVVPTELLLQVAIKQKGYTIPDIPQSELLPGYPAYNDYVVCCLALDFMIKHFDHDLRLEYGIVYREGELLRIVSICSNWKTSQKADETAKKIADYFGITDHPLWYLDWELWRWRFDV